MRRNPFLAELTLVELLNLLGATCDDDDYEDASLNLDRASITDLLNGLAREEEDYRDACGFELVKRSRAAGFGNRLSEYLGSLNLRNIQ